jgi:pyruvate-formate lyase
MEKIIRKAIPLTSRVQKRHKAVEESRFHYKPFWGEGRKMSVVDDVTIKYPVVKRKALAIKKVLSEVPVEIKEGELIVGLASQSNIGLVQPFPEYATEEEEAAADKKSAAKVKRHFGHIEPYHPRNLKLGMCGIRKIAEEKLDEIRRKGAEPEKETFYESVLISLDGLEHLMQRYCDLASTLAENEADTKRKEELYEIAQVCRNLLSRPPETFREALQAFWFTHMAIGSALSRISFGRIDQNLWPYLERDLDAGVITIEEAQELVDLLWLKPCDLLQAAQIQEEEGAFVADDFASTQQFLQSVTVGGLTPDGLDGTNPLTYICLNTLLRLKLPLPAVYVRLHDESPPELYERIADCIRAGCIGPTIYNDELIVPSFTKIGIPIEDARDYTSDGCFEMHIQGKTDFTHTLINCAEILDRILSPANWVEEDAPQYVKNESSFQGLSDEEFKNLSRAFITANVFRGDDHPFKNSKPQDPYCFRSFGEVMDSFKGKLDAYIKGFIDASEKRRDKCFYDIAPLPFFSAFVEGPLESGKDITQGGMKYTFVMSEIAGLSVVADSFAVIKKLCFEEKSVKWPELLDAIGTNWQGNEYLRQLVRTKAPAYGNDIDYVDDIAREITEFYVQSVRKHSAGVPDNVKYITGVATFEGYIVLGRPIGATPDGRFAGEPLGSNASPTTGRGLSGPTAAVNSYVKLPLIDLPGGSDLELTIQNREDILPQLEAFIMSFVAKRGNLFNIAVTNCEELRAAQKEPEKYRDLKVRVAGYDAYFTDLPANHQEMQIRRCEQYA